MARRSASIDGLLSQLILPGYFEQIIIIACTEREPGKLLRRLVMGEIVGSCSDILRE